ncbi:hypothetical protein FB107DRAFT_181667, partial [Schizophyllum commune]
VTGITGDNASNNDVLTTELAKILAEFNPRNRVRCFLHVVNLVSRSLLDVFD